MNDLQRPRLPSGKSHTIRLVDRCADALIRYRRILLLLCMAATVALGISATRLRLDPGFEKMIPMQHPYMQVFNRYASAFPGANTVLVSLRWKGQGDIYNQTFMDALRRATDDVFFIPGVNRARVFSLFTPNVHYTEVTEAGFRGESVVPGQFSSANPDDLTKVRRNVARSGQIGSLVGNDLKSALVRAEFRDVDAASGTRLDYAAVARQLENIRARYANQDIEVDIIGFAKLVGDVEEGISGVIAFFALAFLITAVLLLVYTRSFRTTLLALSVALLPVVWLLGALPVLGLGIDPMSILVPFLIFSIGVSHAVQMTNAWKQALVAGLPSVDAARDAFRKLFVPGTVALLTNALGFMVIMSIKIEIVRELGVTACLGVLLMILTNKVLLPILLSYTRIEAGALAHARRREAASGSRRWVGFAAFARPAPAKVVLMGALVLLACGTLGSRKLEIGDIGAGAPELRSTSRYNLDNAAITSQYDIGVDVLAVIVEVTGVESACLDYPAMSAIERFEMSMRGVAGVQSVVSVPTAAKVSIAAFNEGNPRWAALPRSSDGLTQGASAYDPDNGMNTENCMASQVLIYTKNHEGNTIAHIVSEAKRLAAENTNPNVRFNLGGGNAGVMAATNEAVGEAEVAMLLSIFGAIAILCLITFRSWRAVLCIVVPLTVVSILCNAVMAWLGIGLKVATLPVITLGVGVGVDYGIYLYERMQHEIRSGASLPDAFLEAMRQRGTAALFTAVTMFIGVGTWAFSALKFQVDMGVLLAFMFLVNLFGAVFLLPALAAWLGVERAERPSRGAMCDLQAQSLGFGPTTAMAPPGLDREV
ncbi:MMPL family transporter (plasmid) [Cupriavidus necator]|uniref:RND family transporter n=1 Tax=Cupriavidus necator TaxID=106590 RepID=A0A367P9F6_CUPNE|nr:efflux RND transporter permease subunit [Cupriavidus necator]QQX89153.1 MMPL family transporter [Cupriavidus necator]RCJ04133.1 RND family transporter [Cupriavidus necator]